jgi:hypothetical protein
MSPSTVRVTFSPSGALASPVTPFTESGDVDPSRFGAHLQLDQTATAGRPVRAPRAKVAPEQREQLARIIDRIIDRGLAALTATPVA